jgi:hypothetical protein
MRLFRCCQISVGLLFLSVPAFAGPKAVGSNTHRHATMKHVSRTSRRARATKHEAVAVMPAERATQIQTALIKKGYLTGEPTGTWDPQTVAAMQKLQADNGWQHKITPDARALIKLGLGGPEQASVAEAGSAQ